MYYFVISLSRKAKQMILLAVDVCLVPVTLWLTFVLQANGAPIADMSLALLALPLLMMLAGLLSVVIGIHRIQLKAYESHAIALTGIYAVLLGLATAILDDLAGYGTPLATLSTSCWSVSSSASRCGS